MRGAFGFVAGSLVLGAAAWAQEQPQPDLPLPAPPAAKQPSPAAAPSKFAVATRADLAQLYLRFERTFRDYPPPPERLADVNRAFDSATLQFFGGNFGPAIKAINELTDSLRYKGEAPAGAKFASSLKITLEPVVAKIGDSVEITVEQLYSADPAPGPVLRVDRGKGENSILALIGSGNLWHEVNLPPSATEADFQVYNNDEACFTARVFASYETFASARTRLTAMLAGIKEDSPAMSQALAACKARIGLLQDKPSSVESAQFLANPVLLRDDIISEIGKLQRGVDPYTRRVGDLWRTVKAAGIEVPCRVYAPASAADSTTPHPLLIALHGAGGDESMFFEGYGAGCLKQLADRHGLIVVAPLTYMVMGNGAVFDGIVEAIGMNYSIDPKRIYVLGHSMGGGAAAGLAMQRPDTIAAVCCMAGTGRFNAGAKIPPVLLLAGELDPLIPASRIKDGADAAAKSGLPVEYREAKDYGHTLLVGAKLGEAVEWLVAHTRE